MKKIQSLICAAFLLCGIVRGPAEAEAGFTDVPQGSWAGSYIERAVGLGVMNGYGGGVFGYGDNVTRAQFAAMLVRLFGWETVNPDTPAFADNADKTEWYYDEIETAAKNGAVLSDVETFRPNDFITRGEMAVMLVRGLGYDRLAKSVSGTDIPFADVSQNAAYIAMAYEFGIINGTSDTAFSPSAYATREQAAAMMIRLYDEYYAKTGWLHAFYAISSYSQSTAIPGLDSVSFGWSRLELDGNGEPLLNTTSSGGNSFRMPDGCSEVVTLAEDSGVAYHLNVYMSTSQKVEKADGTASDACREILLDDGMRRKAVEQIISGLKNSNYSGVTIDFEEMKGEDLKQGLNLFLKELRAETDELGLNIYVCVPPVTPDGIYYDAYDYRTIGDCADKVILMAHDYAAGTLSPSLMEAGYTVTPQTPIYNVYYALKAVTDGDTGVADKEKIALALSFGSTEWELEDGKVVNRTAYHPNPAAIYQRLIDPSAEIHYPEAYQNPYITYHDSADNEDYVIWYEDERSIAAKVRLAHMFGVGGVSVWRLGLIPDYGDTADRKIYYDILGWLFDQKQ